MSTLLTQTAPVQLLLLAVFGLICLLLSAGVMTLFRRVHPRLPEAVPVPPFLTAIATAWALALGFAAADIWSARAQAERAAMEERSSVARLAGMADADALDVPDMMEAVLLYSSAVGGLEWIGHANARPAPEVDAALQRIRLAIVALSREPVPGPLVAKMVQDFDELQDARNMRLAIGGGSVSEYKWYLVLFLTFLSMAAIAAVHAERPLAGRNALAIFAVGAVVSLWILIIHTNPYAGPARLQFQEIRLSVPEGADSARSPRAQILNANAIPPQSRHPTSP